MSQSELRRRLDDEHGIRKTATAVSNWVKGKFAPDRITTLAMEAVLGLDRGQLASALGFELQSDEALGYELPNEIVDWIEHLPSIDRERVIAVIHYASAAGAAAAADRILARLSGGGGETSAVFTMTNEEFAAAADRGGADPHEDQVGLPSVRHPGGADPVEE